MKLRLENLSVAFEPAALSQPLFGDLNFELEAGRSLALFGESGSGKTTLLNLVAGLKRPSSGKVLLTKEGQVMDMACADEAARTAMRRTSMGIVFQFFNLIPTLNLRENCLLPLELKGLPSNQQRVDEGLTAMGLGDRLTAFPDQLSGGEQQRVAVLRALVHSPSLVLADEPTGNLDAKNSKMVADLLWSAVEKAGSSLIVATHSESLAERADEILNMSSL